MSESPPKELRDEWLSATLLPGVDDPRESCLQELSEYTGQTVDRVLDLCQGAVEAQREKWSEGDRSTPDGLIDFYNSCDAYIYELLWWHSLQAGEAPAWNARLLRLARQDGTRRYLDFGGGIGTNAILLGRGRIEATSADVSDVLLDFARWRLQRRKIPGNLIDLKSAKLRPERYDLISAIDVLEHLPDPLATLRALTEALMPGGLLVFDLVASAPDPNRPFHLMRSKYPVRSRIRAMGYTRIDRFQKFLVYRKMDRSPGASRLVGAWDRLRWRAYYLLQGKWPRIGD